MVTMSVFHKPARVTELLKRNGGVVVCGSALTGTAVAKAFVEAGRDVTVIDERPIGAETKLLYESLGILYRENADPQLLPELRGKAFAVLSPGIPLDGPLCKLLSTAGLPKLSEIDLCAPFIGMPKVAVTGTLGKSTTVSLIHQMLKFSGAPAELAGNIGRPFIELVDPSELRTGVPRGNRPLFVAEVSSYQLEAAVDFAPEISVWLNLAEHHLERHKTMEEYARVKARIFQGQRSEHDYSVLNIDDPYFGKMKAQARGKHVPFGILKDEHDLPELGCFYEERADSAVAVINGVKEVYALHATKLLGKHNRLNLCAAIISARLAGATSSAVEKTIPEFTPLEHRLEIVTERHGVIFVNDSKATTVQAALMDLAALHESYPAARIVPLIGGKADKASWEPLRRVLGRHVRGIVAFGADGEAILRDLAPQELRLSSEYQKDLGNAVQSAVKLSCPGDVVVLLPGCVSFDAFANFEERGTAFKNIVRELAE